MGCLSSVCVGGEGREITTVLSKIPFKGFSWSGDFGKLNQFLEHA